MAEHCTECGGTGKAPDSNLACLHCAGIGIEPGVAEPKKKAMFHTYPGLGKHLLITAVLIILLIVINAAG